MSESTAQTATEREPAGTYGDGAGDAGTPGSAPRAAEDASRPKETLGGPRPDPSTTASKDPEDWVTGDEPMTGPQRSYLDTLAREAGEELPADLTKADASQHIDRLQGVTGRGSGSGG